MKLETLKQQKAYFWRMYQESCMQNQEDFYYMEYQRISKKLAKMEAKQLCKK